MFQWPNGLRAAGVWRQRWGFVGKAAQEPPVTPCEGSWSKARGVARPPICAHLPRASRPLPPTWMYFMNRWHFPQRERGLPVAARGEKDTSISSSMPESEQGGTHTLTPGCPPPRQPVYWAGWRELPHVAKSLRVNTATPEGGGLCVSN